MSLANPNLEDSESEAIVPGTQAQENKNQEEHKVAHASFSLPEAIITSRDLVSLEAKETNAKALINALDAKYSLHFKNTLASRTGTQTIIIRFPGPIKNRNGVLLQSPSISFDRTAKLYSIVCMPAIYGDPLVNMTDHSAYHFRVCIHCKKLKNAFSRFITLVNKIYFCRACGEYAWSSEWDSDHEMCCKCIIEECLYFTSSKSYSCTICQQQGKRMYTTRCGHHFHRKCLADYLILNLHLPGKCPNCRAILDESDESLTDTDPE